MNKTRIIGLMLGIGCGLALLSAGPHSAMARGKDHQPLNSLAPSAGESGPKVELPVAGGASGSAPKAQGTPANDSNATPPDQISSAPSVNADGEMIVSVSAADDSAILRFPFRERVATAVFIRNHFLWVVFNKPVAFDLSEFNDMGPTVIKKPEHLVTKTASLIRIPIDNNVYPKAIQEDNGTSWTIQLTPNKTPLTAALKVTVNTEPPAPANVFIAIEEMADPIMAQDPAIGDEVVITPLFVPGQGVAPRRDFVEFSLLGTAQGVAVSKKADEVAVTQLRNGLRVSLPQGAQLTHDLPEVEPEKAAGSLLDSSTFFPYEIWKADNPDDSRKQIRSLFHHVVESKNPQEGNEARLRLAQIYLSQGMMPEALAQLDGIERVNPTFYRSAKLAAMRGAANFLMYRFPEAAHDFSAAELNGSKEADYWRNMLADLLGNNSQGKTYDYMAMNTDYISKYPPLFRQRLAIVAADRCIGAKDYNGALKIFDALQKDKLVDPINSYINFLLAKMSADTGQQKDALEMWDKLAVDYKHPFVQARAEFSRIAWGMDHGSITKDDAINRLERLRLAWHGDSLELSVLVLLGDLYAEKKDYIDAMRIWHGGVQSFPNTADSVDMTHKMQEAFITMFNEGAADKLPPLDSLAIYYEYRKYTPPGLAGGEMVERLADRLVSVDLLDQAASVLDQHMRSQTEKEARSRMGTKLATIYLLNHQPKKALAALQDSVYGENQPILRQFRNRLAAQAMADMGQMDKALLALGQDDTEDAERIRLAVYWQQKDWPHVVTSAEAVLKARKDITAPLTIEEGEYVIKLALAYAFENDKSQLQYLHDYFGPLMVNNPQKDVFEFITNGDIIPTPTNFDQVIKNLADTRSFIENYRARIKTSGLAAAVK